MKPRTLLLLMFMAAILVIGSAAAQDIEVSWVGVCKEFNATVTASPGLGCWDVKLDVPGRVLNPEGVWRSSVYYVESVLCPPEEAVLQVRLDTQDSTVPGTAKLRQNETILEKDFVIRQECSETGWEVHLAMSLIFGFFFAVLIVWWIKDRF